MTFGLLALTIVGVAILLFFGGGAIFQRYENGHWGRARGWIETDLLYAGGSVLFAAFIGALCLFVASVVLSVMLGMAGVEVF